MHICIYAYSHIYTYVSTHVCIYTHVSMYPSINIFMLPPSNAPHWGINQLESSAVPFVGTLAIIMRTFALAEAGAYINIQKQRSIHIPILRYVPRLCEVRTSPV